MTAQRQERYGWRARKAFLALLAGFFASVCLDLPGGGLSALAATTEWVVVNRFSGLAIEGFDPVAGFDRFHRDPGRAVDFEASERARSGASATRATAPRSWPIPRFMAPNSRLRSGRSGRGVTYAGEPAVLAGDGRAAHSFGREESRDAFAADLACFRKDANARLG